MRPEIHRVIFRAPVRRSRAAGFLVGVAGGLASLSSATLVGLPLALLDLNGAVVLTIVGSIWFGLFFLSRPLQKHCARSLDSRRPGLTLSAETLSVPTPEDNAITIRPGEPYELTYGWGEYAAKSAGGPTSNTLGVLTHATLTQGGVSLFFKAEDSTREAEAAGWPRVTFTEAEGRTHVRLWAVDLVSLVGAMRSADTPSSSESGPPG